MVQRVSGRSQLDTQKAINWLEEHWKGNRECPVCGHNSWSISDELVEVKPYKGNLLPAVYPLVAVTCNTCGYTFLFNAVVAGLVVPQE